LSAVTVFSEQGLIVSMMLLELSVSLWMECTSSTVWGF